ncbi:TPA: type IV toxin-antitoxin system YeeU family antitoxin [Yersinia enterocolitica]|uniref:type IV toxin-antitoxin system YeeU family antitoxin n=1 Tax=Yersinia TaxID=629 RepID=UPI0005E63DC0|nr:MULTISPECIES: type IV toxin-antitoxin system YeeU family antitoxin [Yersinia]EKN3336597.1 type IV toxin-antitoxin system YeeU family antitoxin [Yersinia enterocolitica]EKN3527664.1 type IV toxin-antitoxin system YeeU family antitoxin [Yersinia enterocolitica]EKN3567924.1 type IV toxin-antitoxin system YeeU family antitoxin [Yersinia enterocolitica]EKN4022375.1 type IV toxin-antitoxin system YeeU family antitoxin [Yersinia enterocolitica]EKN4094316.1 type IV toxin-antitoxin system YeeU famil
MNNHITTSLTWGLKRDITPRLGARLVQDGTHLHFLSDRANIVGTFSPQATQSLDTVFPALITKLESQLLSGQLDPRRQQCLTVRYGGFVCDADTLGSHGYVYIAVYQELS